MQQRNFTIMATLVASSALAFGCGPSQKATTDNSNAATTPSASSNAKPGAPESKIISEQDGPEGSHIKVRAANGGQVTVRTWPSGPVAKVARVERNGQIKAIRVIYRTGRVVRVEDRTAIDHAMDWTAAQLDEVATKSGKVIEDTPARGQGGDEDDEK